MRIPGSKKVKLPWTWLKSRFAPHGLILGYHRISDTPWDPLSISVTKKSFTEHLEAIRRFADPISLDDMVRALREGALPRCAVALTFDDGYADFHYDVRPELQRFQVPATLFVTTGYLGQELWWDELVRIIHSIPRLSGTLQIMLGSRTREWHLASGGDGRPARMRKRRKKLLLDLYRLLLSLSPDERSTALRQIRKWSGPAADGQPWHRALRSDELVELARCELVDIGSHSVTHPRLARLGAGESHREIHDSREALERLLGQPTRGFSYPNGSCSLQTLALVEQAGYSYACASQFDVAWKGSGSFRLPRFWVPDWTGDQLARWLRRWA